MKNKIVLLKDGRTYCRILDTIVSNGNSWYLVIDFKSKSITKVDPKEVWDIVELDKDGKFQSIREHLIERGL